MGNPFLFCTYKPIVLSNYRKMKILKHIIFSFMIMLFSCATQVQHEVKMLNQNEFAKKIKDTEVQLLDVRTHAEYLKAHLPNAININIQENGFNESAKARLDRNKPVAVYCHSGRRSHIASGILLDMGYEVYELEGGVGGWPGEVSYGEN